MFKFLTESFVRGMPPRSIREPGAGNGYYGTQKPPKKVVMLNADGSKVTKKGKHRK